MQRLIPRWSRRANMTRAASSVALRAGSAQHNVYDWLRDVMARFQHSDAVVAPHENVQLTFKQVQKNLDAYSQGFVEIAFTKGSNLGMFYNNDPVPLIVSLGAMQVGSKLVMASPETVPDNLASVLQSHKLKGFVFPPEHKRQNMIEAVEGVVEEFEYLPYGEMIRSSKFPDLRFAFQGGPERTKAIARLNSVPIYNAVPNTVAKDASKVTANDAALELVPDAYANGSSSKKTFSHGNIISIAENVAKDVGFERSDRVCVTLPGSDGTAFLIELAAWSQGGCVVMADTTEDLTSFTSKYVCNVLVVSSADVNAVANEGLDHIKKVIVVGDASEASDGIKLFEGAGKTVFTVASGF